MIYRLTFIKDLVTLLQLRKKKLCCVSVILIENNAICKFKNDDRSKIINFLSFDGNKFATIASSTCDHEMTHGLANYKGSAMTTGSLENSDCLVKTEIYNFDSNQWNDAPDYPYSS